MDRSVIACDEARRKLVEMGFESSIVSEAVKEVGPSLDEAVDFILNERRSRDSASSSGKSSTSSVKAMGKRKAGSFQCPGKMRQTSILDHLKSRVGGKKTKTIPQIEVSPCFSEELKIASSHVGIGEKKARHFPSSCSGEDAGVAWEQKVCNIMHKHFGFSSLKSFQKEALAAWFGNQDCLVLAATGSGKSLCFQIPALFSGKIVVVISPLISLMHDQCLKLSRCGVSACFLGSGQPDSSVEQKAMSGRYNIVYVCPETVLRLIKPLQKLAETHGIALFAIDEVHCVSKWGHDFRPDYRYSKTCAAMQYFRQRLYSVMPLLACSKNERRLAVLRENFSTSNLKFLKFDVPIMALTATATIRVRNDILTSLCMSKKTQIVVTSFFRPNLCFSVKHSKTSSPSSYEKDFQGLINTYTKNKPTYKNYSKNSLEEHLFDGFSDTNGNISEDDGTSSSDIDEDDNIFIGNDNSLKQNGSTSSKEKCMSVEYLEDETEELLVNDWDVLFGEFHGQHSSEDGNWDVLPPKVADPLMQPEERQKLIHEPLEHGPTIIYVPTRKETLSIAKFLSRFGIKAAAYNAKLPKSHLRQVHKEFHENAVEVIVATIAFGMGIDKLNVRRIIHYGWPQSLEAYYQEAGRAGRDGKLAECVLYVNLSRVPTLLPSRRSDEQTKQAYKMLSDCFRYGVNTSVCRAKILVDYFGEESCFGKCLVCDICVNGPPEMQNFKEEACAFIEVVASHYVAADCFCEDVTYTAIKQKRSMDKLNMRTLISTIREQFHRYTATDQLWWRGLARMLEAKGFISERDDRNYVQIKSPEPTELGLEFLQSKVDLYLYPEADMFLSLRTPKCNSTFSEWGRGWADPKVRHQRLERIRSGRKPKNCKPRKRHQLDPNSARGRIAAKLSKVKKGK